MKELYLFFLVLTPPNAHSAQNSTTLIQQEQPQKTEPNDSIYKTAVKCSASVIYTAKDGYKRLNFEIPEELFNKLKENKKNSVRPINHIKLFINALEAELGKGA